MAVYQKRERLQNWQSNFIQKLKYLDTKPFVWGQTDCCNFCGQCVDSITGVNPMAPFAGTYASKEEAYEAIIKGLRHRSGRVYVGETLEGIMTIILGEPKPISMAKRGDVALVKRQGLNISMMVDTSGRSLVGMTEEGGLIKLPLHWGRLAWDI
jgi:hypothetical protein|tara:strand:+ start:2876 stop:3337 length:462 start_codon:yes stop_codon:yes gene_type:complete